MLSQLNINCKILLCLHRKASLLMVDYTFSYTVYSSTHVEKNPVFLRRLSLPHISTFEHFYGLQHVNKQVHNKYFVLALCLKHFHFLATNQMMMIGCDN